MADTTTKYGIPYPENTDFVADGAQAIQDLAEAVDDGFGGYSEGPLGSRPTSTGGTPGIAGREYRPTDKPGRFDKDNGTGWDSFYSAQPQARAKRTTTMTVADSTLTDVSFNSEIFDNDAIFAAPSTDLVCKTAGLYLLDATLEFEWSATAAGAAAQIQVIRSGSEIFRARSSDVSEDQGLVGGVSICQTYRLAVNDVIRLQVESGFSVSSPTFSNLSLAMSRLSAW